MSKFMSDEEVENETEKCRFKLSSKLSKRAPALIADFDHSRVNSLGRSVLKFESFKANADKDTLRYDAQRTLFAHSGHTEFQGTTPTEATPFRNFIGVYDKTTGKMKLYDSVLLRMKPVLKVAEADTASQIPTEKTYWEGMNDLSQSFGTKNRKRMLNQQIKNAADTSVNETLKMDGLSIEPTPESPMLYAGSQDLEYLPQINRDAKMVDQVFDMSQIITPNEQDALFVEAQKLLNADEAEMANMRSSFCKYVNRHLDNAVDSNKAMYLIYLNYLIMFCRLKFNDMRKKDPAPDIPQPFKQRILDTFTQESKSAQGRITRSFPPIMKDKLASYILVLALVIDDYLVNCNLIIADLNKAIGLPKFCKIAEAMGCHIKNQKIDGETVKFAELKLPLYVLPPKFAKKKNASFRA